MTNKEIIEEQNAKMIAEIWEHYGEKLQIKQTLKNYQNLLQL